MGNGSSQEELKRRERQRQLQQLQKKKRQLKQLAQFVQFVQMMEERKRAERHAVASVITHAIIGSFLKEANEQSQKNKNKKLEQFKTVVTDNYNKSSASSPEVIKQSVVALFKQQNMSITSQIPYSSGQYHYLVIGEANTGKTSLINNLFNLKEPVGLGEKTDEAKAVLKLTNGIVLWDAPANDEDFKLLEDGIQIFRNASRIFVVYDGSIKSHSTIITLAYTLKPRRTSLYLVRNKCDLFDSSQHRTLQEEMLLDRRLVAGWKLQSVELLTASAGSASMFDNRKLKTLMSTRE